MSLETRFVFVDTQAFVQHGFDVTSGGLKRLADLTAAGRFQLVLPSVTKRELSKKLEEHVEKALDSLRSFRSRGRVLKNSSLLASGVFNEPDPEGLLDEVRASFQSYLERLDSYELDTHSDAAAVVLDAYFEGLAPFGEGRKKAEFPDAFAVDALRRCADLEEAAIYIVSADGDLEAACAESSGLIHVPSLAHLMKLGGEEDDRAHALVEAARDEIIRQVGEAFEWCGFYLEDQDGDVENIGVEGVELGEHTVQSIEGEVVLFEARCEVRFTCDVSYWDLSTATYDSEDKRPIPWRKIEANVEREHEATIYGQVNATSQELESVSTVHVDLETGGDVPVTAEAWGEYD